VGNLGPLDPDRVAFVAETIRLVRAELPEEVAIVGFAGAPLTLLAYLVEGGGSKDFIRFRAGLRTDPAGAGAALAALARAMHRYLALQTEAGVDAVQLFDTWAGWLDPQTFQRLAVPAARAALADLSVPTIYFAPSASHTLDLQPGIGATGYGVDWRLPLVEAWGRLGSVAIQGNLDPAVLLSGPDTIRVAVADLLSATGPGHVVNLGHGIDRRTPPEHLAVMVSAVRNG
jgi:uroporphyrinogen decarboxylase